MTVLPWTYIFLINIPVGILSFLIGLKTLPNKKPARPGRLDTKGSLLLLFSILLLFSFSTLLQNGVNVFFICGIVVAIVLFVLFIIVEKQKKNPLIPLNIFKNKMFTLNLFTMLTAFIAIGGSSIIMPFYLQNVRGFTPGMAGLLMTVIPLITAVVGPISGTMSDYIGSELLTMIGLILTASGLTCMAMLGVATPIVIIVVYLAILAFGSGLFQSPNNSLVMGSVSREELGLVGSLAGLIKNMGMSVGITAGTSLLYNRMSAMAGYRVTNYIPGKPDVFLYGLRWVYIMIAAIVFLGSILTIIRFVYTRKIKS